MPTQRYVSADMLGLIAELNSRRIAKVCSKMAALNGGELRIDPHEAEDLKFTRRLHHRMMGGDYRMSENEWSRLKDVCEWLVQRHAENHNQPPKPPRIWNDDAMWATQSCPPRSYPDLIVAILTGQLDGATG